VVSAVVSGTPTVVAAFDASATTATTGSEVRFTDRSTGAPTRWAWTFGDGTSSNAQNPTHAYAAPGVYTVTLISSNASNSATAFRTISVSAVTPFRTLLSAAAQTSGAGGTSWRTELNLFNAGSEGANVTLSFLPGSGGALLTKTIFLGARQSTTYANALEELFALENAGGALAIEASAGTTSADLRVSSRTFTPGTIGTYGQSVPDVQSGMLQKTLYVTGLASGPAFRTNVGIVSENGASAEVIVYDAAGVEIARQSLFTAGGVTQEPVQPLVTHGRAVVRFTSGTGRAYASLIDLRSGDATFFPAR
jgi:PKD repeat protein